MRNKKKKRLLTTAKLLTLVVVFFTLPLIVSGSTHQTSTNYLRPIGKTVKYSLIKNAKPNYQILIPKSPSTITQKAANLLQSALTQGTGKVFSIITEDKYNGGKVFNLGNTALYKKSGIHPKQSLQYEGYLLQDKNGNLFFRGGTLHGAISPVIAFIEEDLGGRLYSRQAGLVMPKLTDTITVVPREYVPLFPIRTMFQFESIDKHFQLFNRVGSFTSSYDKIPETWGGSIKLPRQFFVHTLWKLLPNDPYFKTHPEYFALVDGKRKPQGHSGGGELCLTNPEVRHIVLKKVLKELKKYHQYGLFDISANDNNSKSFCECPTCTALKQHEGSNAGPLIDFINYIADGVVKIYPEVKITTLAYKETKLPPKHLKPHKNIIIRLANDTALRPYPICYVKEDKQFMQCIKQWRNLGAKIFIWDYMVSFRAYPMPRPNLEVIGRNIDTYAKNGIYGLFLQSSHYGVGENQGKLRAWVYAHKMWDPSRKMSDLIRDFNYGYFGKAAPLMQQYSDLLTTEWQQFHKTHKFKEVFVFSKTYYPQALAIFKQALQLTADDQKLHAKIELEFISLLFFRLETMPPKNALERQSYSKELKLFAQLTKKYHVDWIDEGRVKTVKRIHEWQAKYHLLNCNLLTDWSGMVKPNRKFHHSGDSCFELYGKYPTEFISANFIPIKPDKSYTLSAWVRSLADKLPASAYLGIRMYDKDKNEIKMIHVKTFAGTESTLTATALKGTKELFIAKNPKCLEIVTCVMSFNVKDNYQDLPNYNYSPRIAKIVDNGENYKVTFSAPLNKTYLSGTKVRLQSPWGAPLYHLAEGWMPTKWKQLSATIQGIAKFGAPKDKFWPGTKYVKPFIWFGNWNRKPKTGAKLLVDDITFTEHN